MPTETTPAVTVLLCAYNAEKYIGETIQSILNQTFADFEFIIYNDGSTDKTAEVIRSFTDKRITFFDNKENYAYVKHLNTGIELAKGRYIARIDADDVALPNRLAQQVTFLDANPEYSTCGTFTNRLNQPDVPLVVLPVSDEEIKAHFLVGNPIVNPSVMLRTATLLEHGIRYDPAVIPMEDANMFHELAKVSKLHNLPEVLLYYRTHDQQITQTKYDKARKHAAEFVLRHMRESGFTLNSEQERGFLMLRSLLPISGVQDYKTMQETIQHLTKCNSKNKIFSEKLFHQHMADLWQGAVNKIPRYTPAFIPVLVGNNPVSDTSYSNKSKTLIKCLLFWKA